MLKTVSDMLVVRAPQLSSTDLHSNIRTSSHLKLTTHTRQSQSQPPAMASNIEVVHAYRHLYRNLLKAVQYTIPARFVARTQIRAAFRERGAVYDAKAIQRTNWFFEAAAKEKGLEHRILKNLLQVAHRRDYRPDSWRKSVAAGKQKQKSG